MTAAASQGQRRLWSGDALRAAPRESTSDLGVRPPDLQEQPGISRWRSGQAFHLLQGLKPHRKMSGIEPGDK